MPIAVESPELDLLVGGVLPNHHEQPEARFIR